MAVDPRDPPVRLRQIRRRPSAPRACGPCTVESTRSAIDACNAARREANAALGVDRYPMVPYPSWMTEETR